MKTKTISRILSTAAVAAMSVSSLFAQTDLGASCGCPSPVSSRPVIDLTADGSSYVNALGEITADLRLDCKHTWAFSKKLYVPNGRTLTIDPGTVLRGAYTGHTATESLNATALVIERGGKIMAEGTESCPIVMTTNGGAADGGTIPADNLDGSLPIGSNGAWGGLVILGKATNNLTLAKNNSVAPYGNNGKAGLCVGQDGVGYIEGFTRDQLNGAGEGMNLFGGTDDHDNSGVLKYVSVRNAGAWIAIGNELNGISFGSVGDGTTVEHIEVISSDDDDMEFFGGSVNVKYAAVMFGSDDEFDYDLNYHGKVQFVFGLKDPQNKCGYFFPGSSDNGIEADVDDNAANPSGRLYPKFYNLTLVSNFNDGATADNTGPAAIQAKELTGGEFYNSVFIGFKSGLHLATSREATATKAYNLGDAYDNWISGHDVNAAMTAADPGKLIVKYNTFVGNTYPITRGMLVTPNSGSWSASDGSLYISSLGITPSGYADATGTTINGTLTQADLTQFITTDGNVVAGSLPGMGTASTSFAMSNYSNSKNDKYTGTSPNLVTSAFDYVANYSGATPPAALLAGKDASADNVWFTKTNYRGAFEPNKPASWLSTWSYNVVLKTTNGLSVDPTDINKDGQTDVNDFLIFSPRFNKVNGAQ